MFGWLGAELPTPTIITSYFSPSLSFEEKKGDCLGNGGAKEGKTLRSREEEEYSVKTGIPCSGRRV
jgi:hypothetical protein